MPEKGLAREIVVGVIVAVVVAAGGLLWNWGTGGGLIRALGGVTAEDVAKIVERGAAGQAVTAAAQAQASVQGLRLQIDALDAELAQIKKFAPLSFTAKGCEVGHDVGELFALHDSNRSPSPPSIFSLSGDNVAGMAKHEWALLHVCAW
jgi:hypothetical protein